MNNETANLLKGWRSRLAATVAACTIASALAPVGCVSAADSGRGDAFAAVQPVEIYETVTDGFTHPGIGLTKADLENVRTQVLAQKEPWYSYFKEMSASSSAAITVTSSNESSADPSKPATDAFNSQGVEARLKADGTKAYTQALMYVITGDETYRANAMHIIRIWSQMDPAKYAWYQDAHIHSGFPLNRLVTAAEIMRYTSCRTEEWAWTDKDTEDLTTNLINPVIDHFEYDNSWFMNQNNFAIVGAMAGFIFTNNREGYDQRVEWFTVNKTARDKGYNGAIKSLFRLVDTNAATGEPLAQPVVQPVEMGRDQAHGADDMEIVAVLARMMLAQGTKVDPVVGTVSADSNAVGPYEFLDDRILAAADYFCRYMLGYDTPWVPVPYAISEDGTVRGIYQKLSDSYRGRTKTFLFWDIYYYYTYVRGVNVAEKAPYFYEAFVKKNPMLSYYQGSPFNAWDSYDGAGDSFWLYIPKEAEAEGDTNVPKTQEPSKIQVEERYTAFDANSATGQDGETSYIELRGTEQGSRIALQNVSFADRSKPRLVGLRFRTDGAATLGLSKESNSAPYHTLLLPNTNREWRYIVFDMGIDSVSYGKLDTDYSLMYLTAIGDGTTVDLDHLNVQAGTELTPPAFSTGDASLKRVTYVGAPVTLDLSANDSGSSTGETVAYAIDPIPAGADLNANTGAFVWRPEQAGTYSFAVTATDGTTLATRRIVIDVAEDRDSAIQAISAAFDPNAEYVTSTLLAYKSAYEGARSELSKADDVEFSSLLADLQEATDGLRLVTPLLPDGSMDYTGMVVSNAGDSISLLADGNNNTYPVYTLAPDMNYILDFGIDYKISATAFAMQGRMNFVDRMAGTAAFGSNDRVEWTRLTSGVTAFTDGMSTIEVDEAYRDAKYRYIKLQRVEPQPDVLGGNISSAYEPSELRIYGQRYETNNRIETVSIGSDQLSNGRIAVGDTVKVTIRAKETIQNVQVNVQGVEATVSTTDNVRFTATATMNAGVATGAVFFALNYDRVDGTAGDTIYETTDKSSLLLVDRSHYIDVAGLAKVTASEDQWPGTGLTKEQVGYLLFDGKTGTYGDLNDDVGMSYTIDFGEGASVDLSEMLLMPRSSYAGRMNGLVVQGSDDQDNWTTMTRPVKNALDGTWTHIGSDEFVDRHRYRYLRLYNSGAWSGNVAEVELYGSYSASAETVASRISGIETPERTATSVQLPAVPDGFAISIRSSTQEGVVGMDGAITRPEEDTSVSLVLTVTNVADGTAADTAPIEVPIAGRLSATRIDVAKLATVTASAAQWPGTGLSEDEVGYLLFDGKTGTYGDLNSAAGSYYDIDFGEEASVRLYGARFMPRSNYNGRLNGLVLQGSNDGSHWSNLTRPVEGAQPNTWFDIRRNDLLTQSNYRYFRLYNGNAWSGNIAEVELYGEYKYAGADTTATLSPATPDGDNGWYKSPVVVSLSTSSGDAEFSLDGGSSWNVYDAPIVLGGQGDNELLYRPVEAGSGKASPRSVAVKIDSAAPQVTMIGDEAYTIEQTVAIACSAADGTSGVTDSSCEKPLVDTPAYTLEPGVHTVQAQAKDAAGHIATIEGAFSVYATIDSLSALTGTFLEETGAPGYEGVKTSLQAKLAEAQAKVDAHKGAETRQMLNDYINEVHAQSGKKLGEEQAEVLARWAKLLSDATPLAGDVPGKPYLSDDNGYDSGLKDGSYVVTMNLWWGNNGTEYKLYENGERVDTQTLSDESPKAQTANTAITGKSNGTYTYTCELTNAIGTTACDPLVVTVTDAAPGMPVLSQNNGDGYGSYDVTMNLWWGTNGKEYRLYENGELIDTQPLQESTPNAQRAATSISGRPPGVYEYRAVLGNAAGETSSETIVVTVKDSR